MSGGIQLLALLRGDASADRAVPPSGATGHLTVFAAAAMTFLAVLALAAALAAGRVADRWSMALDRVATIEIAVPDLAEAERLAGDVVAVLETTPGLQSFRRLAAEDLRDLLAPWLGGQTALDGLPLPVLFEVVEGPEFDRLGLVVRLQGEVPQAEYLAHADWQARFVASAVRLELLATVLLATAIAVSAATLTLAARASLAANAEIIATLRSIGARDSYIARAFVRRFTLRALLGALAGTALAFLAILLLPRGGADALAELAPQTAGGWVLLCLPLPAAAFVAFATTRIAAFRTLARLS